MKQLHVISEPSCAPPAADLNRFGHDPSKGRVWCAWPHETAVLTCDGTIVCGCGDAFNENRMGDARTESLRDIWQGAGFQRMRRGMRDGRPAGFCHRCGLMEIHPPDFEPPDLPLVPEGYPRKLYVEPTIICNLRCPQPACVPEEVYDTRSIRMLPFDVYAKVIDEVGPHLDDMVFYNYGESFIHKDAIRMIRYAKDVNPGIWIWTSTNGHYFDTPDKVRALVDSGIDEIQFSIDGATQEVYEQYRKRGRLDKVLNAIGAVVEERERRGRSGPWILWNYILFKWNDSDEEMERARQLAIELGVDRLTWTTTDQPLGMPSTRFVPGTADYERIRPGLIGGVDGTPNAIRWRAGIEAVDLPAIVQNGDTIVARVRLRNEGDTRWRSALDGTTRPVRVTGRMFPVGGGPKGQPFLVGGLPHAVAPGETVEIEMLGFVNAPPGRTRVKVDLLLGERFWFEELGGTPLTMDVDVRDAGDRPRMLAVTSSPATVREGDAFEIGVRVRGHLNRPIDGSLNAPHRAGVGVRWVRLDARQPRLDGPRSYFAPAIGPGQTRELSLSVPAWSLAPGRWLGQVDLIQEGVTWFEEVGFEPGVLEVTVEGSPDAPAPTNTDTAIRWRAGLEALDAPAAVTVGDAVVARVRIRNDGEVRWPAPDEQTGRHVRAGGRVRAASGRVANRAFLVGALPRAVAPGESVDVEMLGFACGPPGQVQVKVDLLLGEHVWFEDLGGEPLMLDFDVQDAGSRPPLLEVIASPSSVRAGDPFDIVVRMQGHLSGPGNGAPLELPRTGIGLRWIGNGADTLLEGPRCYFDPPLDAGRARDLRLVVPAGSLPAGRWSGKLDVVQEGLAWFEDLGFEPVRVDVTVDP